jgi:hypothetical protein
MSQDNTWWIHQEYHTVEDLEHREPAYTTAQKEFPKISEEQGSDANETLQRLIDITERATREHQSQEASIRQQQRYMEQQLARWVRSTAPQGPPGTVTTDRTPTTVWTDNVTWAESAQEPTEVVFPPIADPKELEELKAENARLKEELEERDLPAQTEEKVKRVIEL